MWISCLIGIPLLVKCHYCKQQWILQQSFHKWHAQVVDTRQTEMGKQAVNPFTALSHDSLRGGWLGGGG